MKKLISLFGLTLTMAFTLTGCELYFGKSGNGGGDDDGGRPPGWACESDADCAAGCYCDSPSAGAPGECAEAGFCDSNADCPDGYVCDDRSSCVPGTPPQTCNFDQDCPAGSSCENGLCEATCVCENDAQAQAAGYAYCDEARQTCEPPLPGGTCGGTATCGTEPMCAVGEVAVIGTDGCFTGGCNAIATCDVAPECPGFQHEVDCLNTSDDKSCSASYTGINCTKPDGSSCQSGDVGCTCESFVFAECRAGAN